MLGIDGDPPGQQLVPRERDELEDNDALEFEFELDDDDVDKDDAELLPDEEGDDELVEDDDELLEELELLLL